MPRTLQPRTDPADLDDLRRRIQATRWPPESADDWGSGTRPGALRELLEQWRRFDWPAVERRFRDERHLLVEVDRGSMHLWRSGDERRPTIVLLHGWPDSFLRYRDVAADLAADFDVIVPSVPGFGFSAAPPAGCGGPAWTAELLLAVLERVGVDRFGVYGGDIGTAIADQVALQAPHRVVGLNLSDVPLWRARGDRHLTDEERAWVHAADEWAATEGAYAQLQRTKPQTLAAGLTDSPAGLASWMLEKFQAWGEGDAFDRVPMDLLLENLSLYWFTGSAGTAARYYRDRILRPPTTGRVTVPTGFGLFPHDIDHGPESFARRWYPVQRFTRFSAGGHFGAIEQPHELAADLREFFAALFSNATAPSSPGR